MIGEGMREKEWEAKWRNAGNEFVSSEKKKVAVQNFT